jgi:hypothetical protein
MKWKTLTPLNRTIQEVSNEKAAFWLCPRMRVEALKKITGSRP